MAISWYDVGIKLNQYAKKDGIMSQTAWRLTYKAQAVGLPIKVVSRWYPSSKRCSCCGWIDEQQTLADRTFICQRCGIVLDRDFNAACNLAAFGEQEPPTVSFTGSHAWGDWRSGLLVTTGETPVREPGTKHCF